MTHGHLATQRTRLRKALLLQIFCSVQACGDVPRNRAAHAPEARPMLASERRESPLPSVRRGRSFANTSLRATTQIAAASAPWSSEPPSTVGLPHHARTLPDASSAPRRRAPKRHSARLGRAGAREPSFN
ncbi:hypothetical protein VTO73DRAFT_10890 [Trametes versicolor]